MTIEAVVIASGEAGAWARLERGELTLPAFHAPFEADCRACGIEVSGARLMAYVAEARAVGLRKPDPRIYELVCRQLAVEPARVVFLDDISRNLKPARALGMRTIKVDDPEVALRELGEILGLDLS